MSALTRADVTVRRDGSVVRKADGAVVGLIQRTWVSDIGTVRWAVCRFCCASSLGWRRPFAFSGEAIAALLDHLNGQQP